VIAASSFAGLGATQESISRGPANVARLVEEPITAETFKERVFSLDDLADKDAPRVGVDRRQRRAQRRVKGVGVALRLLAEPVKQLIKVGKVAGRRRVVPRLGCAGSSETPRRREARSDIASS